MVKLRSKRLGNRLSSDHTAEDDPNDSTETEQPKYGAASLPGARYGTLNQDFALIQQFYSVAELAQFSIEPATVAIVCDGHGPFGEVASQEAAYHILNFLKQCPAFWGVDVATLGYDDLETIFSASFEHAHAELLKMYDDRLPQTHEYSRSEYAGEVFNLVHKEGYSIYQHPILGGRLAEFGTTASVVFIQGSIMVVAHVGDSSVVLGCRDTLGTYSELLTREHNAKDENEQHRLKTDFAHKFRGVDAAIRRDGYIQVFSGSDCRPGVSLAMSRALGHKLLQQYGVISKPDVTVVKLSEQHFCVVAASDGVWEGLDPCQAVSLVDDVLYEQGRSAVDASYVLCRDAIRAVRKQADNTTAAVFVFPQLYARNVDGEDKSEEGDGGGGGMLCGGIEMDVGGVEGVVVDEFEWEEMEDAFVQEVEMYDMFIDQQQQHEQGNAVFFGGGDNNDEEKDDKVKVTGVGDACREVVVPVDTNAVGRGIVSASSPVSADWFVNREAKTKVEEEGELSGDENEKTLMNNNSGPGTVSKSRGFSAKKPQIHSGVKVKEMDREVDSDGGGVHVVQTGCKQQ